MSKQIHRLAISKIKIKNCFVYKDEHEIEFSQDTEKNINVIKASSGTGKSKFFELIFWAIYGKHYHENKDNNEGIINSDLLADENQKEIVASIEIIIVSDGREKYKILRELTATRVDNSSTLRYDQMNNSMVKDGIKINYSSKLTMLTESSTRKTIDIEAHINNEIRKSFPFELNQFLLFNGEKLDLIDRKDETLKFIKDGIEKISGLPLMDILKESISEYSESMMKGVKIDDREFNTRQSQYVKLKQEFDQLENDIAHDENLLQQYNDELLEKENSLRIQEKGQKLQEQIDAEKMKKNTIDDRLRQLKEDKKKMCYDYLPKLWTYQLFKKCSENFEVLRKRNEFPSAFSKEAIMSIIEGHPKECICGRPFDEGSTEENNLRSILKGSKDIRDSQILMEGSNIIERTLEDINKEKLEEKRLRISKEYDKLETDRLNIIDLISGLEASQGTYDAVEDKIQYNKNMQRKGELKNIIDSLETQISDKKDIRYDKKLVLDDSERKKNEAGKKHGEYQIVENRSIVLNAASNYLRKKRDELAHQYRKNITKKTEEFFKTYGPNAGDYDSISITEKYDIKPIKTKIGPSGLSKGQAHSMVISYICGCRTYFLNNLFLMMDSPFHNISENERTGAMEMVLDALSESQVILFMTDSEYTSSSEGKNSIRDFLIKSNKIGKEFEIRRTCTQCNNQELETIHSKKGENYDTFLCKKCETIYKIHDKMGPRKIVGVNV